MNVFRRAMATALGLAFAAGSAFAAEPYASTYQAMPSGTTLIQGATVLTGDGRRIDGGDVLIADGKIVAVGQNLTAPPGAVRIDAHGRWVTPGIIDVHSHIGVASVPYTVGNEDGNEATNPNTADVWVEHSVWTQHPGFETALEAGVTTLQILPGSANLFGGRSVVLRNVPSVSVEGMKFPGAPQGLKMACGENPKRTYGSHNQAPSTRMGGIAEDREAFIEAQEYQRQWDRYASALSKFKASKNSDKGDAPVPPARNLKLETLVGVLRGEILVHIHCYRADDMVQMLGLADEFGFHITAFHHAAEAYKIADLLARKGVCAVVWSDWWGFKMEAYDGIEANLALVDHAKNGCGMVHSDSDVLIQHLNQEAGKAMAHARRLGFDIQPEHAIEWLTRNPARVLGLEDRIGTLGPGKLADVVVWNRDPFSVYALADLVMIDGAVQFDRAHPPKHPRSDLMLGQAAVEEAP